MGVVGILPILINDVFASSYDINNVCEWATFVSINDEVGMEFDEFISIFASENPNMQNDEYLNLLRSNYQDWEIESGLVPKEIAEDYLAQATLKVYEWRVDKAIEVYNVNPELKPLLFSRFEALISSSWDHMATTAHTVDMMLHPDFYGNDLQCERDYLENNSEKVYYWIGQHYGSNRAPVMFDEINSRVYGNEHEIDSETSEQINPEVVCGKGTILKDGFCVPERETMTTEMQQKSGGGGCLIATATYGSELAPQVQQLREIRDNSLLQTKSGSAFMESFNMFYYSFSPVIADYERENLVFKEMVKLAITPLLTSLSILNYVNMDSESEVLGYGISLILLNVGMYFVAPAVIIIKVKHRFERT